MPMAPKPARSPRRFRGLLWCALTLGALASAPAIGQPQRALNGAELDHVTAGAVVSSSSSSSFASVNGVSSIARSSASVSFGAAPAEGVDFAALWAQVRAGKTAGGRSATLSASATGEQAQTFTQLRVANGEVSGEASASACCTPQAEATTSGDVQGALGQPVITTTPTFNADGFVFSSTVVSADFGPIWLSFAGPAQ